MSSERASLQGWRFLCEPWTGRILSLCQALTSSRSSLIAGVPPPHPAPFLCLGKEMGERNRSPSLRVPGYLGRRSPRRSDAAYGLAFAASYGTASRRWRDPAFFDAKLRLAWILVAGRLRPGTSGMLGRAGSYPIQVGRSYAMHTASHPGLAKIIDWTASARYVPILSP